jgi:predicted outer membrane protein
MRTGHWFGFVSASLLVMALTLAPTPARAGDNQSLSPEEQNFLVRAMSDNSAQIAMAKLALQKSQNQKVIDLANTVIQERLALDNELVHLLQGAVGSPRPAADNDATMTALQNLNGDSFDKYFAGIVVRDHNRILSAYQCIKASTHNIALHSIVHKAVPELQGNLMVAIAMLRSPDWAPEAHSQALTAVETRNAKNSPFFGEPMSSIVAAPW